MYPIIKVGNKLEVRCTMNNYEDEAIMKWGEKAKRSIELYKGYTDEQKAQVMEEANENYREMAKLMDAGMSYDSPQVQTVVSKWHKHLFYFYEPSLEILSWLGETYKSDERFRKFYEEIHPNLADFFSESISCYVDVLEIKWLESQYLSMEE